MSRAPKKIVLTIRCTEEESIEIRAEAQRLHQSISSFAVHSMIERINHNHPGRHLHSALSGIRNKPH